MPLQPTPPGFRRSPSTKPKRGTSSSPWRPPKARLAPVVFGSSRGLPPVEYSLAGGSRDPEGLERKRGRTHPLLVPRRVSVLCAPLWSFSHRPVPARLPLSRRFGIFLPSIGCSAADNSLPRFTRQAEIRCSGYTHRRQA